MTEFVLQKVERCTSSKTDKDLDKDTMTAVLGKRKRVSGKDEKSAKSATTPDVKSDTEDLQDIFRRAFEAKFKPLDVPVTVAADAEEEEISEPEDLSDESDWSGLSDGEDNVQIVEHTTTSRRPEESLSKQELKAFMVRMLLLSNPIQSQIPNSGLPVLQTTIIYKHNTPPKQSQKTLRLRRRYRSSKPQKRPRPPTPP